MLIGSELLLTGQTKLKALHFKLDSFAGPELDFVVYSHSSNICYVYASINGWAENCKVYCSLNLIM